jgi:phosphoribosylanthranilate isomerase
MPRVKICGITRHEDAELAASLGAWAVGFNFWPGSKRRCDPAVAAGIARALRRRIEPVGVFVNPTLDEVERLAEEIGLTHVQLHGDEGPSFAAAVAQRSGARVIKAIRVASRADVVDAERFHPDLLMLDGPGNGRAWDWALAAERRNRTPLVVAGGLTADNVADAIDAVHPYAVDVASGVEAEPGIKDPERMRAFFAAVAGAHAGARA